MIGRDLKGKIKTTNLMVMTLAQLAKAAETGDMPNDQAKRAVLSNVSKLEVVNHEELFELLTRILVAPYAVQVIRDYLPVFGLITNELIYMKGFDQQSIYHDLDVLEHTLAVLEGIPCDNNGKRDMELAYAALFHDIGKPEAFEIEGGEGHMYHHPAISARIFNDTARKLNIPEESRLMIEKLICHHDEYYEVSVDRVREFVDKVTPRVMSKLLILQKADIMAHSEVGRKRLEIWEQINKTFYEMDF